MSTLKSLSTNEQNAINEFSNKIKHALGPGLVEMRLFGSKIKENSDRYSDIDILIVSETIDNNIKDAIFDITVDVNLNYDVLIAPVIYDNKRYSDPMFKQTHFFHEACRKGIPL